MSTTSCANCKDCQVGNYCTPDWISTIDAKKSQIWYKKGHCIFYEGNPIFGIYLITQGKIKIIAKGLGGKEQIVRLASNGHLLGRWGNDEDVYSTSAVALEDSLICFINNDLFYELCLANPEFNFQLMMYYAKELRNAQIRIKLLSQLTVKEKIAETLLYLIKVFGIDDENNIAVELSRQEIAEMAGTSSEQVSREISSFKKDNILEPSGKRLIIKNILKLRELVEDVVIQQ